MNSRGKCIFEECFFSLFTFGGSLFIFDFTQDLALSEQNKELSSLI